MSSPARAHLLPIIFLIATIGIFLAAGIGGANAQTPLGEWQTGRSTFYDGIDGGNCGFETIPATQFPYRFVAAANTAFYAKSAACGQCFEVRCTGSAHLANACVQGGSVVVQVTDQCPCAGNEGYCCDASTVHLDLSAGAFAKIADPAAGVIATQYRPVACPVQGQLQVKIKDGSNPWWFALLATNVGGSGAVTKIELSSGGSAAGPWVTPARQDYNYWLATSGSGFQFPLGVRVWQGTQNVTGTITSMSAGATFSLSSNFFGSSSSPSPAPSPSSSPKPTSAHDGGCFIPN